jgi:hypothetical protein
MRFAKQYAVKYYSTHLCQIYFLISAMLKTIFKHLPFILINNILFYKLKVYQTFNPKKP